ncbi:hypothetical protein CHUAL_007626 [Chamberlinius hualienensis]
MACCCRSWCLASIAIVLVAMCYYDCSIHSTLETLSVFPVIGPFLLDHGFVITKDHPLNFIDKLPKKEAEEIRLFTKEELLEYKGGEKGLYLGAIGKVYDVQKAANLYGKGQRFHPLTGRDASRAFLTANYKEPGLVPEVLHLKPDELMTIKTFVETLENDFPLVGKLIGLHYDENGEPTEYNKRLLDAFENGHKLLQLEEELKKTFPGCWSQFIFSEGGKFWCTPESGHVKREKAGFPRKLTIKETGRARCACVQEEQLDDPRLTEYPDCPKDSTECHLKEVAPIDEL